MLTETGFPALLDPSQPPQRAVAPPRRQPPRRDLVRSLFISDTHLGCRHAQAKALLAMLDQFQPEKLYLVGDFIDGWKLKNRWRWLPEYDAILRRLLELKKQGTQLFYTPGNHDEFLRGFLADFGVVDMQNRFVHEAADGRQYLILHGDQFDEVEKHNAWLSLIASYAYDLLLSANWSINKLRGKKHNPYAFCASVKANIKRVVKHVSDFEGQLTAAADEAACDGVICGHIHAPRIDQIGKVTYMNTGDWVENCTVLIERQDGSFELIRGDGKLLNQLPALKRGEDEFQLAAATG